MTTFLNSLAQQTNKTRTENAAATNKSTLDAALDFFSLGGALRKNPNEFTRLFRLAYAEDPLTALRTLFYFRDVRGGQGERQLFRDGLTNLCVHDPDTYTKNLHLVPEYGRWDDIFAAGLTDEVVELVRGQLDQDKTLMAGGNSISLLAKWMPSENASSQDTRALARELQEALGIVRYRKTLSELRKYIHLLEQDMSSNNWDAIEYSKLPSQAHRKHVKAFYRHTEERYQAYLASVKAGEQKINTGTLFTHEVYELCQQGQHDTADAMWAALPDYTRGNNAIVMADVSASMTWSRNPEPMAVSVSLALYFAERNIGPFNGYFMTFSSSPELVKVRGNSLSQRLASIQRQTWHGSTDLEAAFRAILNAAQYTRAKPEELPQTLYIVSDMEFDEVVHGPQDATLFEVAKRHFAAAGYELPHVVFWNVNARNTHVAATKFDNRVSLVSGGSQSTFRYVMEGKTPLELMNDVVHSDRYAPLRLSR